MIDALIMGKLFGQPTERTSKNGNKFVTCKVRVAVGEEGIFVNVICFDEYAFRSLLALGDKDSVAMSGEVTPKVFTDKAGNVRPALDMTAHAVLSPYHVTRKRKAISGSDMP